MLDWINDSLFLSSRISWTKEKRNKGYESGQLRDVMSISLLVKLATFPYDGLLN